MKKCSLLFIVLAILSCPRVSHGMAEERVGSDSLNGQPTIAQPGWPIGIIELLRHDSRVYSRWVNGNESFYFNASPDELNALIRFFSQTRMRDHELWLKAGTQQAKSFDGDRIDYNVKLHVLDGFAMWETRKNEDADTYEPTLTIFLDPSDQQTSWEQIALPPNIIVNNEVPDCPLEGKATKPERRVWYAQVQFDDATPAADFEHGVSTQVTLWQKGNEARINLGAVNREGDFHAAFSDQEIQDLRIGNSWLTLTVSNWSTEPKKNHPRLGAEKLTFDPQTVQPVKLTKPSFYYGRILFEDSSPPILDPMPWPGARIWVDFPYAGSAFIDPEGYFRVYFTQEQYEKLKAEKARENIYMPSYEERNTSRARFTFPASQLSQNKEQAGVVKISKPGP